MSEKSDFTPDTLVETAPVALLNRRDFVRYADQTHETYELAAKSWRCLARLYVQAETGLWERGTIDYGHVALRFRYNPYELNVFGRRCYRFDQLADLEHPSLVRTVDAIDKIVRRYPRTRIQSLLGTGYGPHTFDFFSMLARDEAFEHSLTRPR